MWADTILIVGISVCTALLGEGKSVVHVLAISGMKPSKSIFFH